MTRIDPQGLPDFILIGAQKSGTSSLHHVLAAHPGVFLPPGEIHFFDVDDIEQHPDFFVRVGHGRRRRWVSHDLERDFETYVAWYRSWFQRANGAQRIGEDSTTYLASRLAPRRIADLLPEVRLIAMLRDPVQRCYSHYWHNVGTGRATLPFEATLRQRPGLLLSRGYYRDQLARYLRHVPRERLLVLFFEDFVRAPQAQVDEVCDFLGLEPSVDLTQVSTHRNAANAPLSLRGRLLLNRTLGPLLRKSYKHRIPNMPGYNPRWQWQEFTSDARIQRLTNAWESLRPKRRYPSMAPDTRRLLESIYRRANHGLSDLLGTDVSERWPWMSGGDQK